jgi:hypothetical protein
VSSKSIASILTCFFFLLAPTLGMAQSIHQNVVAEMKEGEPAPFDGVLMSHDVVAEIVTEIEYAHESCMIDLEEQRQIITIEYEHKLAQCELLKRIETDRLNKLVEVKQQRIDFLEKRWTPVPWYETPVFWYAAGVASGIILTTGTAYLLLSANN